MLGNFMITETSSFRLNKEAFTALKNQANKQGVKFSTLK